jgi:signal transduction histidine kinase
MGLLDIQERVRLVSGTCAVKSAPAAGTEVEIELPLQTRSAMPPRRDSETASTMI